MEIREFIAILVVLASSAPVAQAQRPGGDRGPVPGPNRIEVRFAIGKQPLQCKRFSVTAKVDGRVLVSGKFKSSFEIPTEATDLAKRDAVEVEFECGKYRWHFTGVGERAFLRGWWWVGIDYPPFQSEFRGPRFEDAIWVRYLITDPLGQSGFVVYKFCPAKLKDVKPGPCHTD